MPRDIYGGPQALQAWAPSRTNRPTHHPHTSHRTHHINTSPSQPPRTRRPAPTHLVLHPGEHALVLLPIQPSVGTISCRCHCRRRPRVRQEPRPKQIACRQRVDGGISPRDLRHGALRTRCGGRAAPTQSSNTKKQAIRGRRVDPQDQHQEPAKGAGQAGTDVAPADDLANILPSSIEQTI